MDRELALTREQRERIEKIIAESQDRTRSLWKPIAPQMGKEMQSVRESIRGELTPEQQRKFDELIRPRPMRNNPEFSKDKDKERRRGEPRHDLDTNSPASVESAGTNPPAVKPEPHRL